MSNILRDKIYEALDYSTLQSELDEVMRIVEEYLEKAFDAAKDQKHLGCGDYEDKYWSWNSWYDEEVNI